jgi:hypothetical protein
MDDVFHNSRFLMDAILPLDDRDLKIPRLECVSATIFMVWHRLQWLNHGTDGHNSLVTSCDLRKENLSDPNFIR